MANEYVDIDLISVRIPGQGLVVLEDAMSLSKTVTRESTVVFTMNRKRVGRGYRHGPKSVTFELEVPRRVGGDEVDWFVLQADKTIFQIYAQGGEGSNAVRRHLVDCIVDEVVDDSNQDGEASRRITGKALDERRDQANSPVSGADLE